MTVLQHALRRCGLRVCCQLAFDAFRSGPTDSLNFERRHNTSKLRKSEVSQHSSLLFLAQRQPQVTLRVPQHGICSLKITLKITQCTVAVLALLVTMKHFDQCSLLGATPGPPRPILVR